MTDAEILLRLRGSKVRLAFDTSAVFDHTHFVTICELVNQLNVFRAADDPVELAICAAAHAEKLFDLKQATKDNFDEAQVMQMLARIGVRILPFDRQHARRLAELLGTLYPDTKSWRAAKRRRYIEALGIQKIETEGKISASGKSCSATVDWLIAAHALEESCLLVTEDKGPEFRDVDERVKSNSLKNALEQLLTIEQSRASSP